MACHILPTSSRFSLFSSASCPDHSPESDLLASRMGSAGVRSLPELPPAPGQGGFNGWFLPSWLFISRRWSLYSRSLASGQHLVLYASIAIPTYACQAQPEPTEAAAGSTATLAWPRMVSLLFGEGGERSRQYPAVCHCSWLAAAAKLPSHMGTRAGPGSMALA